MWESTRTLVSWSSALFHVPFVSVQGGICPGPVFPEISIPGVAQWCGDSGSWQHLPLPLRVRREHGCEYEASTKAEMR